MTKAKYEVIISPHAEGSILSAFRYIHERSPDNAELWLKDLYSCIDSLESFPERCALARELEYFEEELRQLVFKSHRIVFYIDKKRKAVRVAYFVHGKQRAVGEPIRPDTDE